MDEKELEGFMADNFINPLIVSDSMTETVDMYEKRIYDLRQLLEISKSLCSTLEYDNLIESIIYTCMGQMHVMGAGIFVLNDIDSNSFDLSSNHTGLNLDINLNYSLPLTHPMVEYFSHYTEPATLENVQSVLEGDEKIPEIESLEPTLIVPLFHKNHLNGILVLGERLDIGEGTLYSEYDKSQIEAIASLAAVAINNAALLEKSSTDMMTHLKLKYFFYNSLTDALDVAISQNQNLAVLMFDIDHFKKFNDTWGHACGDFVLKTVAKLIKDGTRDRDIASRYGGEEFTVMLPNTDRDAAMKVAERIRQSIEKMDFIYADHHMHVTISIGCAVYDSERNQVSNPKELVEQADKALYFSKGNGRNKVSFADESIINNIEVPK